MNKNDMDDLVHQFQKIGEEFIKNTLNNTIPIINNLNKNKSNKNEQKSNLIPFQKQNYDDSVYILCELPGFSKDQCKLKYNNNRLYITAKRFYNSQDGKWNFIKDKVLQNEIYVGEVNKKNIIAEMNNGLLKIILKKYLSEDSDIEIN